MAQGATASAVSGQDVAQLNHDLVALGYAHAAEVNWAWHDFSRGTRAAVERLQHHLGVERTGRLDLGDVVFLPGAARVTAHQATLGGPAAGPVLRASSTARTVNVALDPNLQAEVQRGDPVVVTLPDGTSTPGRITSVGTVATVESSGPGDSGGTGGSDSGPTIRVQIRLLHPAATGRLDQALVEVAITGQTVHDALAVPVTALVARAGGGYAVEVVGGDGTHHLVPVRPGLFDDAAGLVQVSGSGLVAGQYVVVPSDA
jgi:multidrug efflux pump subunit AcrA (membrane-fusion protein)